MQIRDVVLFAARLILSQYNRKCGNGLWLKASVFLPVARIADSAPETLHNRRLGLICEEREVADLIMHWGRSSTSLPRLWLLFPGLLCHGAGAAGLVWVWKTEKQNI